MSQWVRSLDFFRLLHWIDGSPLLGHIEPYRRQIFTTFLDTLDAPGRVRYNLGVGGRAKKNFKSADLVLTGLCCLCANDSPSGNQCYLLANDEGQAADDLDLAKKLCDVNPVLQQRLVVKQKTIERRDGRGFLMVLPGQFAVGEHGKTYRFAGFDEIHGQKTWALLEALQLDPTRGDAQMWITSYASLYHRPGVPLFDLMAQGKAGTDPRMFFSWYGADYTTDPDYVAADPETRANPSRGTWVDPDYLRQQQRRVPAHIYRRLHLNLPGLPDGAAYTAERVMNAIARGVTARPLDPSFVVVVGFVDMSGGSNDDAVLAIAALTVDDRLVLLRILNQGPPPPFDPRAAVARFAVVLREYGCPSVWGDKYAGETFVQDFARHGISYHVSQASTSQLYEAFEPLLNARDVILLEVPILEQQLLGLLWRGGRIDHPAGEHDDWANAAVGALLLAKERGTNPLVDPAPSPVELEQLRAFAREFSSVAAEGLGPGDAGGGDVFRPYHPLHVFDEDLSRWR
jgi:hypothetical protein